MRYRNDDDGSVESGINAVASGTGSVASGDRSLALGYNAAASAEGAIALGEDATNAVADTAVISVAGGDNLVRLEVPGAVTQLTDVTTAVTLNAAQGKITMFGVIATGAVASFTVTNSRVQAGSVILAVAEGVGATDDLPCVVGVDTIVDGSFDVIVYNPDSGNSANPPVIHFFVYYPV